jgi:hypothetical protein
MTVSVLIRQYGDGGVAKTQDQVSMAGLVVAERTPMPSQKPRMGLMPMPVSGTGKAPTRGMREIVRK